MSNELGEGKSFLMSEMSYRKESVQEAHKPHEDGDHLRDLLRHIKPSNFPEGDSWMSSADLVDKAAKEAGAEARKSIPVGFRGQAYENHS